MKKLLTSFFLLIAFSLHANDFINNGWSFFKGSPADSLSLDISKSQWKKVDLPHTFNLSGSEEIYRDYKSEVIYAGDAWYRKNLTIDKKLEGKRLFLYFGAAYIDTDVYINGIKIGNHKGGYSAFNFEITSFVKYGADNLICVKVNNEYSPDITPLGGGYVKFGGITRPMELIVKEPFCISPLHYASSGVYCKQLEVSAERAVLSIENVLNAPSSVKGKYSVVCSVIDSNGKVVAREKIKGSVVSGEQWHVNVPMTVKNPKLWDGIYSPILYTLKSQLYLEGKEVDCVEEIIGFRSVAVDKDKGFFLNGKSYPLHGVSQHEYYPGVGSALHKQHYEKDMELMLDLGANALRCSHYPHAPYRYELCDKTGVISYAELAWIMQFHDTDEFRNSCTQQMNEMVYQLYNHPSIAIWGLFNEIRFDVFKGYNGLPLVESVNKIAKDADPSRLTCGVSWMDGKRNDVSDLSGWNRYPGWYWNAYPGGAGDFQFLDKLREEYPNRKLGLTEYSCGGAFGQFDENRNIAPYNADQFHPVDYFNYSHEKLWESLTKREWIWGTFIWTLTEFLVPNYDQGRASFVHDKGLVHEDRVQKKDAYYFYKANWRKDVPVFHLSYKEYPIRMKDNAEITVYSNLNNVSLSVNGVDKGTLKNGNLSVYRWSNVSLKEGDNKIVVWSVSDGKRYEESVVWHHVADINNSPRVEELVAIKSPWKVLFKDEVEETKRYRGTGVPGEAINSKFNLNSKVWGGVPNWDDITLPLYTKTKTSPGNWTGKMVYLTKEFTTTNDANNVNLYLMHSAKMSKANLGRVTIAIDNVAILTLEEGYEDNYRLINISERLGTLKSGKHTISVIASTPPMGGILDVGVVNIKNDLQNP